MEEILMRYELGRIYDVDILSESDSHLANKFFIKSYSERTKQTPEQFKNLRTFRKEIHLKDVIFDNVKFETPALQKMLDTLKSKTVISTNGLIYPIFKIGNLEINGKTKFKIDDKEYNFKYIEFRKLKNEFLNNESKYHNPKEFPKFFPLYLGGMMAAEILYLKK